MKAWNAVVLSLSLAAQTLLAQGPTPTIPVSSVPETDRPALTISVNVVERTAKAINYRHRGGSTTIDFKGTQKMPAARGEAKVESKQGYIEIEVEFDNLRSATQFGPEYLTYVMWAITPEGRATNLGEVILNGTKSKLNVTTELQAFGLVVTAEPYFAVSQPSDVVVMENAVRWDTLGQVEQITTRYELLQQGQYTLDAPPGELKPLPIDKDTPLDLNQARNAVRIARWAGAHTDASESFEKAQKALQQAEAYKARKAGAKPISMMAREAAQTAEDARLIALKRQEDQRLADERQASANRESEAKAQADRARAQSEEDSRRRAQAELEQRLEAERRARAEAERTTALALAEIARERALRDQAAADQAREAAARAEAERKAALAMAETEKARALNERAAADQAREAAARAEREKLELRSSLIQQLNLILDTRETDRGLVNNISDGLFDTGQYTLKPAARCRTAHRKY